MTLTETPKVHVAASAGPSGRVSLLSLAGMEMRAGLRGSSFKLLAALFAVFGWLAGASPGHGVAQSAWATGEYAWRYAGLVIIGWISFVGVQDIASRTDVLLYSKPQPTERIVLSRFFAAYGQVLLALVVMFMMAAVSRLRLGGDFSGMLAYVLQWTVSASVLLFASAASYTFAVMARTPLAGAAVGLYWVLAMAGKSYLPKAVFPAYSQNALGYVLMSLFLLGAGSWFYRFRRRGRSPVPLWVRGGSLAALAAGILFFWHGSQTEYDPMVHTDPSLDLMSAQDAIVNELTPGFRLPTADGRLSSLADYRGKIFVIALWSPDDPESTLILDRLEEVFDQYGSRGVQPIAICLSQNRSAPVIFSQGARVKFPLVHDWGTHNAEKIAESSPMAVAYNAEVLPYVVVTDRRRLLKHIVRGVDAYEGKTLNSAIEQRLLAEPE